MSFECVSQILNSDLTNGTEVAVLVALAHCLNEQTGDCFPSTETISRLARRSPLVVRKALKRLTDLGYISQSQSPGAKRFFSIHLDKITAFEGGKELEGGKEQGGGKELYPEQGSNKGINKEVNQEEFPPPSPAAKREAQTHLFSLSEIPDASKEKTRTHQAFKPPELGVELTESAFRDWMTVRKAKHSPLTETAWKHFKAQVLRSELSIQQAVELCATKGWISINAEWQAVKDYQAEFDSRSSNDRKVDFVIKALGLTDNRKETEK